MDIFQIAANLKHLDYISDLQFLPAEEKKTLIKQMNFYKDDLDWADLVSYLGGPYYGSNN